MQRITRRRALFIGAAAAILPGLGRAATPVAAWNGNALGAHAEIRLAGLETAEAAPVFARIAAELHRLEDLFSLYRPGSALSRLNRQGWLDDPAPEMLEVLGLARSAHRRTGGLFDPSVQPLFALQARHAAANSLPSDADLAKARALVGFDAVGITPRRIAFARPGMALTLNGIAQGYVTDRIAALLRAEGMRDMLLDIGEIRALGQRPGEAGWKVGLGRGRRMMLRDRAIAASNRMGTVVNPAAGVGHIFDPRTGSGAGGGTGTVHVLHASAALADAYSTAAALAGPAGSTAWVGDDLQMIWT